MKKLLSLAFMMAFTFLVASTADAQTYRNGQNRVENNKQYQNRNNRGVQTHTETKIVRIRGQQYRETYEIKQFPNGRTTSKLISRVQINNRINNRPNDRRATTNTFYETKIVRENGRRFRVTYKITQFRNGRTSTEIVSKVRVK